MFQWSTGDPKVVGNSVHEISLVDPAYLGGGDVLWREIGSAMMLLLQEKEIDAMICKTIDLCDVADYLHNPSRRVGKISIAVCKD